MTNKQQTQTQGKPMAWINWTGGDCPVADDVRVEYVMSGYPSQVCSAIAGTLDWRVDPRPSKMRSNIAQYRCPAEQPAPVDRDERCASDVPKMMTVPREWVEHYAERLEECCGYEKAEIVRASLAEPEGKSLDDRMKAAGMFSVAQMLAGAPLDRFMAHAGVRDLSTFVEWVETARSDFLRQLGRYELGETVKDDLYEWVVAHSAVLGEVHVNLKAALRQAEPVGEVVPGVPNPADDANQDIRLAGRIAPAVQRSGPVPDCVGALERSGQPAPFQARVRLWMLECFGPEIASDRQERNHRFLEEALELVQACGATADEAQQLVSYVFGRPAGEPIQEVGGVMVTLAALCLAGGLDMAVAGETELSRIWTKVDQIRAKQAAKPAMSPLPGAYPERHQSAPATVILCRGCNAETSDPDHFDGAGKCISVQHRDTSL